MRKLFLVLAGAVSVYCALGIVSASAADVAPVEPVSSWTGFYLGAGGGYRWADFDVDTLSCAGVVCNNEADDGIFPGFLPGPTFEDYSTNLNDDGSLARFKPGLTGRLHLVS